MAQSPRPTEVPVRTGKPMTIAQIPRRSPPRA
jgi:hypothetical protein